MKNSLSLNRPTKLLIAGNMVLALIVSAELLLPAQPGTANAAAANAGDTALPEFGDARNAAPPVSQFADMTERPLFFPDRRMPKPKVETAPPPPPPTPLRLKLEGVAIAGGSRIAVLRNLNGNGLLQLAEGDSHDGWTLDDLTTNTATFSRNGEQITELPLEPVHNSRRR